MAIEVGDTPRETPAPAAVPAPVATNPVRSEGLGREAPGSVIPAAPVEHLSIAPSEIRPKSTEVTDISLTLPVARAGAANDERVAIRMIQRAGEIHVSVRTPDAGMAQSLRQDLARLASSLDDAGFRADAWRPAEAVAAPASSHSMREFSQETHPRDTGGNDARQDGSHHGAGQQQRRQRDERPRWVAELEQQRNR